MKAYFSIFALVSLLLSSGLFAQQDGSQYYGLYAGKPVKVINRTAGSQRTGELYLVGVDRGDLLLSVNPNQTLGGQIGLPIDTQGLNLQVVFPNTVVEAINDINTGNYEKGIAVLRPMVYPLLAYLKIPEDSINIHKVVERYLYALVNSNGNEVEAAEIIRRLPLNEIPPAFTVNSLVFVSKFVEMGNKEEALRLLNRIPMDPKNPRMLDLVLQFANDLRSSENYDEALLLYDRLQSAKGTEQATLATLWSAYCNVALDRFQIANLFVEKAGDFKPEDKPYSLARLVQGKIELQKMDFPKAMEFIAEGVVATDVGYNWAPELTFTVGYCYENMDFPDTAREVYKEVILFYPDSIWSTEAEEATLRLPPPAPREEPGA
ncbi:MAG: tetratricopeptide repeat protein [Verrucomicrobiota bacterium]